MSAMRAIGERLEQQHLGGEPSPLWRKFTRPEHVGVVVVGAFIAAFGSPVPQRDDIDLLRTSALFRSGASVSDLVTSEVLWANWNGHRLVVPRLLASGLLRIGKGDFRILMFASLVVAALTIPALLRLLPLTLPYRRVLATLTVFGLSQSENWLWGFQLSWFLVNFCVLWALALAQRARHTRGRLHVALIAGALASCAVATVTSAHGVLSWFAVACMCAFLGQRRAPIVWGVIGLTAAFLIRSDEWSDTPSASRVITVAIQLVGCVLKLPAAWFRRDLPGGEAVPLAVGIVLTVLAFVVTAWNLRAGRVQRGMVAGLLGLQLYVVGFIVMASWARSDPFYETPAQSRYATVTLLGLLCLITLAAQMRSSENKTKSSSARVVSIIGGVALLGASVTALPSVTGWRSSVDVIERCVEEWRPDQPRKPDCKYAWDGFFDAEWKALRSR